MKYFDKFYNYLNKFEYFFIVIFLSGMFIIVSLGVFYRYVLNNSLTWTEELARYLMIWCAYFGMSRALEREKHVGVVAFINMLPEKYTYLVELFGKFIIMFFLVFLFRYSFAQLKVCRIQTTSAMGICMIWPYMAVTFGSLLMILKNIKLIYEKIVAFKEFDED